jgi:hypothetical protein
VIAPQASGMTTTENAVTTDPRPLYRDAPRWVAGLVARIRAEQLIRPTPCSEFDSGRCSGTSSPRWTRSS